MIEIPISEELARRLATLDDAIGIERVDAMLDRMLAYPVRPAVLTLLSRRDSLSACQPLPSPSIRSAPRD